MIACERALPGLSLGTRLRSLGRCVWFRDGADLAVFLPEWGGRWTAIVFDVAHEYFVMAALDLLFADPEVEVLSFVTHDPDSGHRIGAAPYGRFQIGGDHAWFPLPAKIG